MLVMIREPYVVAISRLEGAEPATTRESGSRAVVEVAHLSRPAALATHSHDTHGDKIDTGARQMYVLSKSLVNRHSLRPPAPTPRLVSRQRCDPPEPRCSDQQREFW